MLDVFQRAIILSPTEADISNNIPCERIGKPKSGIGNYVARFCRNVTTFAIVSGSGSEPDGSLVPVLLPIADKSSPCLFVVTAP